MNNQHQCTKLIIRIIGFSLLIVGIILAIIGFANFGNFENNLFSLTFIGLPCIGFGLGFTIFSFSQNIARFVKNEHAPIINEFSEDITPAIQHYTSAVKNGFLSENTKLCGCGKENPTDSKFCSNCGKALSLVCPNCKKILNTESKFCNECGTKLN
jgi:hypothetical protein